MLFWHWARRGWCGSGESGRKNVSWLDGTNMSFGMRGVGCVSVSFNNKYYAVVM